ncbi:hypothetical protein PSYMO_36333, partial [Pseudomonas amygdali pv. mori str. 301020]
NKRVSEKPGAVHCASKPDYYVSPTPVYISATATYWVESFKIAL